MSQEGAGFGLILSERFFGFVLIVLGALALYYTLTSLDTLQPFQWFFVFLCAVPLALGVFLLLARIEK
jgi:hypothetical protein